MSNPFEVSYEQIERELDAYIDHVFRSLQSELLVFPKGDNFVSYERFRSAYEQLRQTTSGFERVDEEVLLEGLEADPLGFVVVRSILGMTAVEWGRLTEQEFDIGIPQGYVRNRDAKAREGKHEFQQMTDLRRKRVKAMLRCASHYLHRRLEGVSDDVVHRLNKVDTGKGVQGLRHVAEEGVPYAVVLYERFLGRPFASHRDSVSELIGNVMENAVEEELREAGVSFRETKRAENVPGFEQAPDFIIPDEFEPEVVIEAKITNDDGTARDKVTRIQHLHTLSREWGSQDAPAFQVVACIDGLGFGVRREDMRKLFEATDGKVFTTETLDHLTDHTDIRKYRTRQ
jgi:hypothetical protein